MNGAIYCDNISNFLGIQSMGYSENPNINKYGPAVRNQYIIHYVLDGVGYYNNNRVIKGQGFLIYPSQKEVYYPSEDNPWKFLWVIADNSHMEQIFDKYNANSETKIFEFDNIAPIKQSADYIMSNNNKIISSLEITELFLHMANSHISGKIPEKHKSNADIYTDFCIKYINENIYKKITVNELTNIIGVSQPYLYTIFKNRFGMSIKQYITTAKHSYAKKLLKETKLTVKEVANSVGYDDVFVFSKSFKQLEQVSPTKYLEKFK